MIGIPNIFGDNHIIHDNKDGEINTITEKASPVAADLVLIEDSEDSNNKKKVQAGNLPASSGFLSRCSAYGNTPQTITQNTPTKITLGTEEYDNNAEFANSRFTCKVAGFYHVDFACSIKALGDGKVLSVRLYKNGALIKIVSGVVGAASDIYLNGGCDIQLVVDDYLELYVNHTHVSSRDTVGNSTTDYLNIHRFA